MSEENRKKKLVETYTRDEKETGTENDLPETKPAGSRKKQRKQQRQKKRKLQEQTKVLQKEKR